MPRLTKSTPKYRHHKATGQAIVTIEGRDRYLGPWKSKASRVEYDRLICEWLARGRPDTPQASFDEITVKELVAAYWTFSKTHYRKDGKPTREVSLIKEAMRPLLHMYGSTLANQFGPRSLKAVRQVMIARDLSRGVVNSHIGRIRRMFKWGVEDEVVSPTVLLGLQAVRGLQKGRSEARETAPVLPVEASVVENTLLHLPPIVADMVRIELLTGCRPTEVCQLRPCDIDRSGEVWTYRPESHKTEHHGRLRIIHVGPKAQQILLKYLLRDGEAFCFSPAESEKARRQQQRGQRKTKVQPSQRNRRSKSPKKQAREFYDHWSYRRAIHRACDLAFPPPNDLDKERDKQKIVAWKKSHRWSPNRLRHSAATAIRRQFGLEAAQVTLGHASADVTQVYAERDSAKAVEVMRLIG